MLEVMAMEVPCESPCNGVITEVFVKEAGDDSGAGLMLGALIKCFLSLL